MKDEMDFGLNIYILPAMVLVVARFGGMMIFAPVFGEAALPVRLRALIAVAMAMGVAGQVALPTSMPMSNIGFGIALIGEALVGMAIGYAARLVFVGVELGAFHVGQQMGLSLGEVFSPMTEESPEPLRRFFHLLALVIYLAVGGHRLVIGALIQSFETVPLTNFINPHGLATGLAALLTTSFVLALKVAAPVLLAMLLAGLALAFLQRTLPQLNFLSIGLPIRIVLAMVIILAVLGTGAVPDLISSASSSVTRELRRILEVL